MQKHTIYAGKLKLEFADNSLNSACLYADDRLLLSGIYLFVNNAPVQANIMCCSCNHNKIEMQLVTGNLTIFYSIELTENSFDDSVRVKTDNLPKSVQLYYGVADGSPEYMPIPFEAHDKRPQKLTLSNLTNAGYEGCAVYTSQGNFVVAKHPSDDEPFAITLRNYEGKMLIGNGYPFADNGRFTYYKTDSIGVLDFNKTRYQLFSGSVEDGFIAYRRFMSENGVTLPENYNPSVNYCIYYELTTTTSQFGIQQCEGLNSVYVHQMAEIAKKLGCGTLYFDQGWDTSFGSLIWDEARLGKTESLVADIKAKGLDIGILIPLHSSEDVFDSDVYKIDEKGDIQQGDNWHSYGVCPCSNKYAELRRTRLKKVADAGISFFSYDFNNYDGACYIDGADEIVCNSPLHGHSIPCTAYEHAKAIAESQRLVKEDCKNTLIESHDWYDAGGYVYPIYMFGDGHHERWGFEYMWRPLEDYREGRLQNLYYYNLAYEKPLYLHMNLLGMGENAEAFWYLASTIRHFGIGNYTALTDEQKQLAERAMGVYCQIKDHLVHGIFDGQTPNVHVHTLKDRGAVVLVFGTESNERIVLDKAKLGITTVSQVETLWNNADIQEVDDSMTISHNLKPDQVLIFKLK